MTTERPVPTRPPACAREAARIIAEPRRRGHCPAVGRHHFHLLGRFADRQPRRWVGIAKKCSALALSGAGLAEPGGVWAVRCHCEPITDREHQLQAAKYVADHEHEGAVVWAIWREKRPPG